MLTIPQGTTWGRAWPITDVNGDPIDLTGWTARAQVRESAAADTVLHEWSTTIGNLTLADSKVTILVTPADSNAWTWRVGHTDIELTDPTGRIARIVEDTIVVTPQVTR